MNKSHQTSTGQALELTRIAVQAIASALKSKEGYSDRVQEVIGNPSQIYDFFRGILRVKAPTVNLVKKEEISIAAVDGTKSLLGLHLPLYADRDYQQAVKPGFPINEIGAVVYELSDKAQWVDVFSSISDNWDRLCLSESQIVAFFEQYLEPEPPTDLKAYDFLTKADDIFFMVRMGYSPNGGWSINISLPKYTSYDGGPLAPPHLVVCPK
ncbi:hypothetical protein EOM71_00525 [Candidatus Falkowbacteria bacterium]|nr:hypothetical protein [Candidatus Falkowbacteria bacterium]